MNTATDSMNRPLRKILVAVLLAASAIHCASHALAQEREQVETAWPGDIVGLHNHGTIAIGDTFTEGELCSTCLDERRDARLLCVVETPAEEPERLTHSTSPPTPP